MANQAAIDAELRRIANVNNDRLTPDLVLQAAIEPNSPLHEFFEWDDSVAAMEHRRAQARALIRTCKINVTTTTLQIQCPVFIRDPGVGKAQGYINVARLRTEEDNAREAVLAEFHRASAALERAKAVAVALGMSDEIESLRGDLFTLSEKVQQAENSGSVGTA